jgi:uncharacterized protein YjbI with pentapeptide repeats
MTRDETVALFLQGREAWNAWAEKMLAERKSLEGSGRWAVERDLAGVFQPRNEESANWVAAAKADFSDIAFQVCQDAGIPASRNVLADEINFDGYIFPGETFFTGVRFSSDASFVSVRFLADVTFEAASFLGECHFDLSQFAGRADYTKAKFDGKAVFREVRFHRRAVFNECKIAGWTSFFDSEFHRVARFSDVTFQDVLFRNVKFLSRVEFVQVRFGGLSLFEGVTFQGYADFKRSIFAGYPNFIGIRSERAFDLAGATFSSVPDFLQAHFEEAPRLDNLRVLTSWRADRDAPARWRTLKRLAIQGHDVDGELEFHAREVKSARFAGDLPLPLAFWRGKAWGGFFRFWFGIFYQIASDFGRSLARPLGFWLLAIIIGAVIYVSQSTAMIEARHKQEAKGASKISAAASRAWYAWLSKPVPCYAGQEPPPKDKNGDTPVYVGALSPSLASGTDLANEAWHLAFRNAFIVLDGSAEAAHRTYGCLYGVELYGGSNPLAVVPSAVSTVSAAQKLFSALMIFLFGLALRNMLKMK